MRKIIEVNGKQYEAAEFTFNTICEMDELGYNIMEMKAGSMNMLRVWLSLCMKKSPEEAGKELQNHIVKGGSLETIINTLGECLNESDFFRAISEEEEKKVPKVEGKKKKSTETSEN